MSIKIEYTDTLGHEIFDQISTSTKGLEALCKQNKHWPAACTIRIWINEAAHPLSVLYARAKELQIAALVDRIFVLTKDRSKGYLFDKDGLAYADQVYLAKIKLEIDAIKWLASKLSPRLYGDKNKEKDNGQDALSQFKVDDE